MSEVVSFSEALEIVRSHAIQLPAPESEMIELLASSGRVVAEEVTADRDQPPFNRSTRDGYAVRAVEWSGGEQLRVTGQIRAGESSQGGTVSPGSAIEIMTGAPVPPGADAVGMLEHADRVADQLRVQPGRTLRAGENIVVRGAEARKGQVLLAPGDLLGPAGIALAASCGRSHLRVMKRPEVAIAANGDELVALTESPEPHQIRNSNTYAIAAMVAASGGLPLPLEIARDCREDICDRVAQSSKAGLLVLSGGVSAGKYDLVEEVLAEFGAEFLFTGVRMQPGKPVVFGRLPGSKTGNGASPDRYFFGLPGNPVSTQVTFQCFVEPFLRVLAGAKWAGPHFVQAIFAEDVAAKPGLTRLLPARLETGREETRVSLISWNGSGDLAANARADCYAVLPPERQMKAGDIATVLLH